MSDNREYCPSRVLTIIINQNVISSQEGNNIFKSLLCNTALVDWINDSYEKESSNPTASLHWILLPVLIIKVGWFGLGSSASDTFEYCYFASSHLGPTLTQRRDIQPPKKSFQRLKQNIVIYAYFQPHIMNIKSPFSNISLNKHFPI